MATGGGLRDDAKETGDLTLGDDALQRLEQRLMECLDQRFDQSLCRFEERFDELTDRFEGLGINVNRNRRNDRRLGADLARGNPVDRPVSVHRLHNLMFSESSEEEENDYFDAECTDYGDIRHHGGFQRGYDRREGRQRYDDHEGGCLLS